MHTLNNTHPQAYTHTAGAYIGTRQASRAYQTERAKRGNNQHIRNGARTHMQKITHTHSRAYEHTNMHTHRASYRQQERHTCKHRGIHTYIHTYICRQANRGYTHNQRHVQTYKQTYRHTGINAHIHTYIQYIHTCIHAYMHTYERHLGKCNTNRQAMQQRTSIHKCRNIRRRTNIHRGILTPINTYMLTSTYIQSRQQYHKCQKGHTYNHHIHRYTHTTNHTY